MSTSPHKGLGNSGTGLPKILRASQELKKQIIKREQISDLNDLKNELDYLKWEQEEAVKNMQEFTLTKCFQKLEAFF